MEEESIWCFFLFFVFFSQFMGGVVSLIVFFSPCTHISILAALSSCFLGLSISVRLQWHSSGQGTYFPLHLNFSGHYQKAFGTAVILSICFIDKSVIPWSSPSHTYAVIPAVSRAFGIKKTDCKCDWCHHLPVSWCLRGLLAWPKAAGCGAHVPALASLLTFLPSVPSLHGQEGQQSWLSMASPHLSIFSFFVSLLAAVTQTVQALDTYLWKLLLASVPHVSILKGST